MLKTLFEALAHCPGLERGVCADIFLGGITGQLYRQFAITVSVSILLSALCALTLSPALCALMLRPTAQTKRGLLGRFFDLFNRGFDRFTRGYQQGVRHLIRHALLVLATLAVLLFAVWGLLKVLPTGFVPEEDTEVTVYSAAVDVFFEVDLWGRLARATEAARAGLLSSEFAKQTVIIYPDWRCGDRLLRFAQPRSATRHYPTHGQDT
ncbi:MAG: efflux RND transporter permease subunit [Gammaproteobacteria bacterium]